jgi:DNA-binding Xre family transcriptional regulator
VGRIVSKARKLRLELQMKLGRLVTMQEVAEATDIERSALNRIELGRTDQIRFETLVKLCKFYSEQLGREIGVGDVLEYDPNNKEATYAQGELEPAA